MQRPCALIVDDDVQSRDTLSRALTEEGIVCRSVSTASEALAAVDAARLDIVIVSLDLPIDALALCRRLRARVVAPLLVSSVDGHDERRVSALDDGASDCLTKPFSMPEVTARVRVALRNRRALAALQDDEVIECGQLRIDPNQHIAVVRSQRLALTPKEFALATLLARNPGKVMSHATLIEAVWASPRSRDSLRHHVKELRRKLDPAAGAPLLLTETGIGYRLVP